MKKKSLWGVGIVISFIIFAVCILAVVYISVTSRVDLVADNYYENELKYQSHIDVVNETNSLEQKVELTFAPSTMNILFPKVDSPAGYSGTVSFFRPSDKTKDYSTEVKIDSSYAQSIPTEKMTKGMWRVKISWKVTDRQFYFEQPVMLQ